MVGETRRHRRQARRPRLRLTLRGAPAAGLLLAAAAALGACAYSADPPGGPPRLTPPRIVQIVPESGAVLTTPPREADIVFDEVISERATAGAGAGGGGGGAVGQYLQGAVLLSPEPAKLSVEWHRQRISVQPKGGFLPGRIYRLELLPVISDLRNNKIRRGRVIVFSTGPDIPHATLRGTIVDWAGNHAAVGALVQAELLPDTLTYLALTDSAGNFTLAQVPPGAYLVYGVLDQNGNRIRDPREAFDTARVTLADSAAVALYTFVHDTLPPRIRTVEFVDSVTVRITFDRLLDPSQTLDTSRVRLALATDSTTPVPLAGVVTPAAFDSVRHAQTARQDSLRRAAQADSLRRADSLRGGKPAPGARGAAAPRPVRPPPLGAPVAARGAPGSARADTGEAQRMLRRRPAPSDTRVVELAAPLAPGSRYLVRVTGVRSISGVSGASESTLPVPKPPPPAPRARTDTSHAAPRRDSLPPPAAPRADSGRPAAAPPP